MSVSPDQTEDLIYNVAAFLSALGAEMEANKKTPTILSGLNIVELQ
jgi:hypothetical protein